MKISLLFLTWIALSTSLGVGFGYSPYGLVPWTAALSLGLSLVVVLIAVLVSPGQMLTRLEKIQASGVLLAILFLVFAVRAFSQVIFIEDGNVKVLSPNNLGDICLHLTQINFLASNPHYWPENPIYAFDKLRYPIGIDIFNAELKLIGISPNLGIILVAFLGSLLTVRALFLFGGPFAVAAFLFNGGLVGFMFFQSWPWHLEDYQADIAWKSIPLALFVTQRGLLYAIPAGLILITHWRRTLDSQTDRSASLFLGGMAAVLHDAAFSSAYIYLSVVPIALVVPVWESKLARPSDPVSHVFVYPGDIFCLWCYRVRQNQCLGLGTWLDFSGRGA